MNEKAILVGILLNQGKKTLESELNELESLCNTLGIKAVKKFTQSLEKKKPGYLIGSGKVKEIEDFLSKNSDIKYVIFDETLSPSQSRNLERRFNKGKVIDEYSIFVIDRTELILDIFASRAHTHEGKLQVELARNLYFLPRLKKMWSHLSRQRGGGVGNKGEGEMQIEIDRRQLKKRISFLKSQLENVKKVRLTQRKKRESVPVPVVSFVGYTNAGKSTLLNALTNAGVFVEDKLFATLDPAIRKFRLKAGLDIILIDTVGFIRKIPHMLVESFNATLEEITRSDLILNIVDGSDTELFNHIKATENVLKEIKSDKIPKIEVINKMDKISEDDLNFISRKLPDSVFISAKNKHNFDYLQSKMISFFESKMVKMKLNIPYSDFKTYHLLKKFGNISKEEKNSHGVTVSSDVFFRYVDVFKKYTV